MLRLIAFLAALLLAAPLHAELLNAKPETVNAVLAAAKPGDVVRFDENRRFADIVLPRRDHDPPVEIIAHHAKLRTLVAIKTAGWRWQGGTIEAPETAFWGARIQDAARIEIAGVNFRGGLNAATIITSQDIALRGNIVTGMVSDGFNVAASQRVQLVGNTITGFLSREAVWKDGVLIQDAPHADGIQLWSLPDLPPTSDILIAGNRIEGKTQGITHFWHAHQGRPKVERVTVERNEVAVESWWGIGMLDAPGVVVRNNVVRTLPNAAGMKARLMMDASGERGGNVVDGVGD